MSFLSKLFKKSTADTSSLVDISLPSGEVSQLDNADLPLSFTWINKQGVRSNRGFEVQCTGRFTILYKEGAAHVELDVEFGEYCGGPSVSIKRNAFERWDNASYRNSPEKQAELLSNFRAAMEFQGLNVDA